MTTRFELMANDAMHEILYEPARIVYRIGGPMEGECLVRFTEWARKMARGRQHLLTNENVLQKISTLNWSKYS